MQTITLQPLPLPSPRGHKFSTCVSPVLPSRPWRQVFNLSVSPAPRGGTFSTCRVRPAFTLVELLVVIVILAMLASLVTVAGSRAMTAARNAAIKSEIDMLHMAIMNYKNEYGSFPPCLSDAGAATPAATHIQRLFPRCNVIATQVQTAVHPANALLGWLGGYTTEPTRPVVGEDLNRNGILNAGEDINGNGRLDTLGRERLFGFDQSRSDTTQSVYYPSSKKGSPYIYINNGSYRSLDRMSGTTSNGWPITSPETRFSYVVGSDTVTIEPGTYYPTHVPSSAAAADWTNDAQPYFNPDSFQILCAGADETFGNDDDLSNFWPGTRKAFIDSLAR
jgi:prepilin-type N-terminal cleavage/methylation domain-containing protein